MNPVMLSIIVCTHNQEKYIADAIESLLAQRTEYRFEIIIGDDASIDSTPEIIRSYAEKYPDKIRPIFHKKNLGCSRNGYELFKLSRGKYLAGVDGDDCWHGDERIQRQVDFLEKHPEYSAVCGRCVLIGETGEFLDNSTVDEKARFWEFDKTVFTWRDFEKWKMPGHGSALTGRNFWIHTDAKILYEAHDTVGDRTGVMIYLLSGPIRCTDEIASCYRIRTSGRHFMQTYAAQNLRAKEVHLMCALEHYARKHGAMLDLSFIKKQRLIGATCIWMKDSSEENFNVVKMILDECDNTTEYRTIVIQTILLKCYYWKILHEDRPIDIGESKTCNKKE